MQGAARKRGRKGVEGGAALGCSLPEVSAPFHRSNCLYNEPFHPDEWTRVYFSFRNLLPSSRLVLFSFVSYALETHTRDLASRVPSVSLPPSKLLRPRCRISSSERKREEREERRPRVQDVGSIPVDSHGSKEPFSAVRRRNYAGSSLTLGGENPLHGREKFRD